MSERRNDLEIVKGRAIKCTIQLGSISSLRCQKSRMPDPVKDLGCEVMFSRTDGYGFYRKPAYALTSFGVAAFASFATLERRLACPAEAREASEGWWSQTGSNRRPHACKARALPAELWPRNQKTNAHVGLYVGR